MPGAPVNLSNAAVEGAVEWAIPLTGRLQAGQPLPFAS